MKKTFRQYHLLNILNSFSLESTPLDVHVGQYFRKNRAIGSKDRRSISEKVYRLIRWIALVDHYCPKEPSQEEHIWSLRSEVIDRLDLKKASRDRSLPSHIRASFPKSLFSLLEEQFGRETAFSICLASNSAAPITIRANLLKTDRRTLWRKWQGRFPLSPTQESLWGIHFEKRFNFAELEEFQQGLFEVQDEGSQLIANLVGSKEGDQVLDYCAGSGGKTLAFAHKMQRKGQIYLHDIRPSILIRAKRRLKRSGIENAQILPHDSPQKKRLKGKMDWVLVDVPCSGSGTLRRNPDLKWKFSMELLDRLVKEQREIFQEALEYVSPKGRIVYATCSLLRQENEEQIEYFQDAHHLSLATTPFRSLPVVGGMDGFFGAVLKLAD